MLNLRISKSVILFACGTAFLQIGAILLTSSLTVAQSLIGSPNAPLLPLLAESTVSTPNDDGINPEQPSSPAPSPSPSPSPTPRPTPRPTPNPPRPNPPAAQCPSGAMCVIGGANILRASAGGWGWWAAGGRYIDGFYYSFNYGNGNYMACACLRGRAGCFPPGTQIETADRSNKAVEEIRAGDMLYNPATESPMKVKQVIESGETLPLIQIISTGSEAKLSQTHPVLTKDGIKKARDVTANDFVKDLNGNFQAVSEVNELEPEDGQRVINFIFETESESVEDHLLISDGIVTGDLILQMRINEQ